MRDRFDLSFANVRKRSFYVTQPMRQATIQPLRALGLVESSGERFNAFRCSERGREFIEATSDGSKPYHNSLIKHLVLWVRGAHDKVTTSPELTRALSPLEPLPANARNILRERLIQGSDNTAARRRRMLEWVEVLRQNTQVQITWDAKPANLDDHHWRDLHVGSLFFAARDAAISLLDWIEAHIANVDSRQLSLDEPLPQAIEQSIAWLRERALDFLDRQYDPSPEKAAELFCRECTEKEDKRLLEKLIARDGRGLRQSDRDIVPGAAFRGIQVEEPETARSEEEDGAETVVRQSIPLPEGISHRVRNLFFFNLDLMGELNDWLYESIEEAGEER